MPSALTIKAALRWLTSFLLAGLLLACQALYAESSKVVVMTSYPQEVVSTFEAAFEQQYPQYKLEVLWRQSRDAMAYFKQPPQPVDVYWTPAQRNFAQLEHMQALAPLDLNLTGLPEQLHGYSLRSSHYIASEIAGYGIAINPKAIQAQGLPSPSTWQDLTATGYRGKIGLPVPSKVGYAPPLIDILLQGYGWQAGWNLLQALAANAELVTSGATFISDDVANGRLLAGLTIDFFTASAIANGAPLQFVYPEITAYSPAHIAIMRQAANVEGARAFQNFVLSEAGQRLLFHPDVRKLPVLPSVYAHKPDNYYNPYASNTGFIYDSKKGLARQELTNALFDAIISLNIAQLQYSYEQLTAATQKLGADAPQVVKAKALIQTLPIPEPINPESSDAMSNPDKAQIQAWQLQMQQRYAEAARILAQP